MATQKVQSDKQSINVRKPT